MVTSKAQSMVSMTMGELLIVKWYAASTQGCRGSAICTEVSSCYLEWAVTILGILLNCSVQFFFLICKVMTTLARSL